MMSCRVFPASLLRSTCLLVEPSRMMFQVVGTEVNPECNYGPVLIGASKLVNT